VTKSGDIRPSVLMSLLDNSCEINGLVAVSHGNNEIGTIQPITELCKVAHDRGYLFHVDVSQTAGRLPLAIDQDEIDLACISSHKMYGPAGIGALYITAGLERSICPLIHGGGQERGIRSGTIAPFLAVGFGTAAAIAKRQIGTDSQHQIKLTDLFLCCLRERSVSFEVIGHKSSRLPGHLSLLFYNIVADDLLAIMMPKLSVSAGAACATGELRASHVLRAIGLTEDTAGQVVRISFGRDTKPQTAIEAANIFAASIEQIKRR
jgi:cysteine desulfurase